MTLCRKCLILSRNKNKRELNFYHHFNLLKSGKLKK